MRSGEFGENAQLTELLRHCYENVPFYRKVGGYSLDDYPILTKNDIKASPVEHIDRNYAKRSELAAELCNLSKAKSRPEDNEYPFEAGIVIEETSGSSGVPLRFAKSRAERARLSFFQYRERKRIDRTFSPERLYLFSHIPFSAPIHFDVSDHSASNLFNLYTHISKHAYTWIHATPRVLNAHLDVLEREGLTFDFSNLRAIECNGNFLDEESRRRVGKYFGCTLADMYGTMETYAIAYSVGSQKFRVNDSSVLVELLNEDGRAITSKNEVGRIAVTTLGLRLMPMIRYDLGDFGSWNEDGSLTLLEGRECDLLLGMPDRSFGSVIFRRAVRMYFREYSDNSMNYIQVVQSGPEQFGVHTNRMQNPELFIRRFSHFATICLGKAAHYTHNIMEDDEIRMLKKGKHLLFLRRC